VARTRNISCLRLLTLSLLYSLLLAHLYRLLICKYSLCCDLYLLGCWQENFNSTLFVISSPMHPPLSDLQLVSEPNFSFGLTTEILSFGYIHLLHLLFVCALILVFMASHDFSSIKSPPKFDGLNFPIWKV